MKRRVFHTELVLNISIAIVATILITILAIKFLDIVPDDPRFVKIPNPGNRIQIEGYDFSHSKKNVILVLQKHCRFCAESAPFYAELVKQFKLRDVRFVAFMPQEPDEARAYLESLNVSGIEVLSGNSNSIGVNATPAVIIVDDSGTVVDGWVGKLAQDTENEVIYKISR